DEQPPEVLARHSDLAAARSADGRLDVGRKDPRFWPAAGVVLDVLAAVEARVADAAVLLGLSTGNLIDFLQTDPKLWQEGHPPPRPLRPQAAPLRHVETRRLHLDRQTTPGGAGPARRPGGVGLAAGAGDRVDDLADRATPPPRLGQRRRPDDDARPRRGHG